MEIENVPTESNPRTGRITALSVLATLRRLVSPLRDHVHGNHRLCGQFLSLAREESRHDWKPGLSVGEPMV